MPTFVSRRYDSISLSSPFSKVRVTVGLAKPRISSAVRLGMAARPWRLARERSGVKCELDEISTGAGTWTGSG